MESPAAEKPDAEVGLLVLPLELIIQICHLVSGGQDIKSLRQCCKLLNEIVSPRLFPVLYVSCYPLDLKVLRLVAGNPLLLSGVRELVIDDNTMHPKVRITPRAKVRVIIADEAARSDIDLEEKKSRTDAWAALSKEIRDFLVDMCHHHQVNRDAQSDLRVLKKALPGMKRLKSLVFTNRLAFEPLVASGAHSHASSSPSARKIRALDSNLRQHMSSATVGLQQMRTVDTARPAIQLYWHLQDTEAAKPLVVDRNHRLGVELEDVRRELLDFVEMANRKFHIIATVLNALKATGIQETLTAFRVDASYSVSNELNAPGLPAMFLDNRTTFARPFMSVVGVIKNLKSFQLVMGTAQTSSKPEEVRRYIQNINRLIEGMPQLEELVLEVHKIPIVGIMIGNAPCSHLRSVTFACGQVIARSLEEFLCRQAATLETLVMDHCYTTMNAGGSTRWERVVRVITELQAKKKTRLGVAKLIKGYREVPPAACGKLGKRNLLDPGQHYWTYGDPKGLYRSLG